MSKDLSSPLFAALSELVSRGQAEISSAVDALRKQASDLPSLKISFSGASKTAGECSYSSEGVRFVAETADKRYVVSLPTDVTKSAPATVQLFEIVDGQIVKTELSGVDIFDSAPIPDAFKELHERLTAVMRRALPPELLAKFTGDETPSAASSVHVEEQQATEQAANAEAAAATSEEAPVEVLVQRKNLPNLRFSGVRLAQARTSLFNGRQQRLSVFKTVGGKFIAILEGLSLWPGELPRVDAKVFDKLEDVVGFFGHRSAAKHLYAQLQLDTDEIIA